MGMAKKAGKMESRQRRHKTEGGKNGFQKGLRPSARVSWNRQNWKPGPRVEKQGEKEKGWNEATAELTLKG